MRKIVLIALAALLFPALFTSCGVVSAVGNFSGHIIGGIFWLIIMLAGFIGAIAFCFTGSAGAFGNFIGSVVEGFEIDEETDYRKKRAMIKEHERKIMEGYKKPKDYSGVAELYLQFICLWAGILGLCQLFRAAPSWVFIAALLFHLGTLIVKHGIIVNSDIGLYIGLAFAGILFSLSYIFHLVDLTIAVPEFSLPFLPFTIPAFSLWLSPLLMMIASMLAAWIPTLIWIAVMNIVDRIWGEDA
jgi:hypothetical protein